MYILEKLLTVFYTIIFSMILVIVILAMLSWSAYMAGILPLLAVLVFIYLKKKKRFLPSRTCRYLWYVASGCSLVLLIWTSFTCKVYFSWDWGKILLSSAEFVTTDRLQSVEYYARYPNNQLCLICVTGLFQFIQFLYPLADIDTFQNVSIVISCLFVWGTINMIYLIGKEIWGLRRAVLAGLFSAGCLPFYMYAQFLYTDTPGLLLLTVLIYFDIKIFRENSFPRRIAYAILTGAIAGITYHVKVIPFIIFIAMIFAELFHRQHRAREKAVILASAMLICLGTWYSVGSFSDQVSSEQFGITAEAKKQWQFPLTHWIMMGLNRESMGGYHERDVIYTSYFPTMKEREFENIKVIQERMHEFGIDGFIRHVIHGKLPRTWGNSCLAGDDYLSRLPKDRENDIVQFMMMNGKYHDYCLVYTWTYYVTLFVGIILSGIMAIKNWQRQDVLLMGRIALLGLAFFQIFWECNSRYLITFIPLLIIMTLDGYFKCKEERHIYAEY